MKASHLFVLGMSLILMSGISAEAGARSVAFAFGVMAVFAMIAAFMVV